jgi:Ser/Thr protein kinase RdoA (MazF antagonist)
MGSFQVGRDEHSRSQIRFYPAFCRYLQNEKIAVPLAFSDRDDFRELRVSGIP